MVRIESNPETAETDRTTLAAMAGAIAFRGPDAQQEWTQNGTSFAFSFLATGPAPQAVTQPVTLDGETWFLGEARFDGRDELLQKLRQPGNSFSPALSDEELLLHFVARFGFAELPRLDGDFSFVLWKPREQRLIAFRDLTGARPFFYSHREGKLAFSNTLQALLADPEVSRREYDPQFIGDFLLGAPHHDPERTVYREVRRLPAGSLLEFSPRGLWVRRVANLPIEDLLVLPGSEVLEEFHRLFTAAVRDRLPARESTIFLSGGLDSTSIAAKIVELRKESSLADALMLHALCVDFQPLFDDPEGTYTSRFAEALGIPLRLVHSGDVLPFENWEHTLRHFPEPLPDPYAFLYLSYRAQISRWGRIVFSGDGGDELLRLQAAPYLRFLRTKRGLPAAAAVLARWLVSQRRLPPLGFGIRSGLLRWLGGVPQEPSYPPWLASAFAQAWDLPARCREIWAAPLSPHPFNPKAYQLLNNGPFPEVQEICEPTWTRVPLETRNPFLDRRLCRFLLRIPPIPWAMNKYLLRTATAGILPEEIRRRPKAPVRQDPLVLHVQAGHWHPAAIEKPPELLHAFVDWPLLLKRLGDDASTSLYVHLRPVALSRWLNALETGARIQ